MRTAKKTLHNPLKAFLVGSLLALACGMLPQTSQAVVGLYTNYAGYASANEWVEIEIDSVTGKTNFTWEAGYEPTDDIDNDGLTNIQEFRGWEITVNGYTGWFTFWLSAPVAGGGVPFVDANDANFFGYGPDLESFDTDCDGISDLYESDRLLTLAGTNPRSEDTDADGLKDPVEIYAGLDPKDDGFIYDTDYTYKCLTLGYENVIITGTKFVDPDIPSLGDVMTLQNPKMDIDGDALTAVQELKKANDGNDIDFSDGCPLLGEVRDHFPSALLDEPSWTSPFDCDTDNDWMLDSFEKTFSKGGFNAIEAEEEGTDFHYNSDPDGDGLTSFREQCLHPLLSFGWGNPLATWPFVASSCPIDQKILSSAGVRWKEPGRGGCLLGTPGYLSQARYSKFGDVVRYFTIDYKAGWVMTDAKVGGLGLPGPIYWPTAPASYWTEPRPAPYHGWDTDLDGLPDGWEVEHGLNPKTGLAAYDADEESDELDSGTFLDVMDIEVAISPGSGLGDPDHDDLLNVQEYYGQDGYRVDFITGTGDETIPWITRAINYQNRSEFEIYLKDHTILLRHDNQAPMYWEVVLPGLAQSYNMSNYPGFFHPVAYATATKTNWVMQIDPILMTTTLVEQVGPYLLPTVGVPSFPYFQNDMAALQPYYGPDFTIDPLAPGAGAFQAFATTYSGLTYIEPVGSEDGRYTPGIDNLWFVINTPGEYTPEDLLVMPPVIGDYILSDPDGLLTATLLPGVITNGAPITDNIPLMVPMPGWDSDSDGISDAEEIQRDVRLGDLPTCPVLPMNPLVPRSAKIVSDAGMETLFVDDPLNFTRDFTVETWVYLDGDAPAGGSFIKGYIDWPIGSLNPTSQRKAYDLGVTNVVIDGVMTETVPYIGFHTLGGHWYEVNAFSALPRDRWVHLAGGFDHGKNALSLYVNGTLVLSLQDVEETIGGYLLNSGAGGSLSFAEGTGFADHLWMDEIRVWGIERSGLEVAANSGHLMQGRQLGILDNEPRNGALLANYTFDDGGNVAIDNRHRALSSLLGYDYPANTNVVNRLFHEYFYPDRTYALVTTNLGGSFVFDDTRAAPVQGELDVAGGEMDSDGDSLADSWELIHELNPFSQWSTEHMISRYDPAWATLATSGVTDAETDFDNDGLSTLYEFWAQTNPRKEDTDADGIVDGEEDFDGDNLSNGMEWQSSSSPLLKDTDDDGLEDGEEVSAGTDPANSQSPEEFRAMDFNGSGRLVIRTEATVDSSLSWTVEAWVKPVVSGSDGIALRRAEAAGGGVDYELGLAGGKPYILFTSRSQTEGLVDYLVTAPDTIPANTWTHLAAVRDISTLQLRLFVNGKCVDTLTGSPSTALRGVIETVMGENFIGELDAVRVWDYVRSGADIQDARGVLVPETDLNGDVDTLRAAKRLFNFDDGGVTAENSYYAEDWLVDWEHAADLEGGVKLVTAAWPPMDLDSDDDGTSDVDERSNNTLVLRSESPYRPRALRFNGLGRVEAPEQVDGLETMQYASTNWTIECWVKPTQAPATSLPLMKRTTTSSSRAASFELGLNDDLTVYAGFNRQDALNAAFHIDSGSKQLQANVWTHLAASYSSEEDTLILYINGVEQIRGTDTSARPVVNRSGSLELGSYDFKGELREVRVWNLARPAGEILANYAQTLLFSVASMENSFHSSGEAGNQSYMSRVTEDVEDGFNYDYSSIGYLIDGTTNIFPYITGHSTHKFTLETWIRMDSGAAGGYAVTRRIDLMLLDDGADWRNTEAILISENGEPTVEWQGQIDIVTPVFNVAGNITKLEHTPEVKNRLLISEVDIRDGDWHHLAAVGDSVGIHLYIDGKLDSSTPTYYRFKALPGDPFEAYYFQYGNADSQLRIGDGLLEADLDEVLFWNEDRTEAEIQHHMLYGLTAKETSNGRENIVPTPEYALADGSNHVDLVSYMFFDGPSPLPFVVDAANEMINYRILPNLAGDEILVNSRPPVFVDRLRALKDYLPGYFAVDDGGQTAENFMKRNDISYAGQLYGDAHFVHAGGNPSVVDSDGDGLPDSWESEHDLDAGNPDGADGAYGDADGDGLTNLAEYLAGTDPNNWDTDGNGISDYDTSDPSCVVNCVTYGEYYMDGDQIPDLWELQYADALSPLVNDAHTDPDGDGWDNLSEYLGAGYEYVAVATALVTNDAGEVTTEMTRTYTAVDSTDPSDAQSFPTPRITFTFTGDCTPPTDASLVIQAFSDPTMSHADVIHTVSNRFVNGLVETVGLWNGGTASGIGDGHVRQGENIFMAFIDANGDGVWNAGEWMGYSANETDNISWGSADIQIALTDKPAGYIRFSWEQDLTAIEAGLSQVNGTTYRVTISPVLGSIATYSVTRNLESLDRPYITEMDLKMAGVAPMFGGYKWVIGTFDGTVFASGTNSITYSSTLAAPTVLAPANTTLALAENQLQVEGLSQDVTEFKIAILRRDATTLLTTTVPVPVVNSSGLAEMTLPWLAGWGSLTNDDFSIRVAAVNPLFTSGVFSTPIVFSVNLQEAPVGAGTIKGSIGYFGTNSGSRIVEAFVSSGFAQKPVSRTRAEADGSYVLLGLRAGTYSVRGFVDANANSTLDPGEAWGFVKGQASGSSLLSRKAVAKASAELESPYATEYCIKTVSVDSQGAAMGQDLMLHDALAYAVNYADSDGDGLTDEVELRVGTSPVRWDSDFDGLSDYDEPFVYSTDPTDPDTDNDGMLDGWEVLHGLNPLNPADGALDSDGDGLTNAEEYDAGTLPKDADTDKDGMPDGWEVDNGLNPLSLDDRWLDGDHDGLTNLREYMESTNPSMIDTDGDGIADGYEYKHGLNPLDPTDAAMDGDGDGLNNLLEYENNADSTNPDTDGDGIWDGLEVIVYFTRPDLVDTDSDGLDDYVELMTEMTDPLYWDTDGDGYGDGVEVNLGTDPLDDSSFPDSHSDVQLMITSIERSNHTAAVVYQVSSIIGAPAILEFMVNDDLMDGAGWTASGIQWLVETIGTYTNTVTDPDADGVLNIRIGVK